MNSQKKGNITIRTDFVIYNTKSLFDKVIVKVPSYVIQDVIAGNKNILIKLNEKNIALYTTQQLKENIVTVEAKIYEGFFRKEKIKYNLTKIRI